MQAIWAICRRDLIHHFTTPRAWLVLAVWTFVTNGVFAWALNEAHAMGAWGEPIYLLAMTTGSLALMLLAPAMTMNAFASERIEGSLQLLLTVPITELEMLLGKYLAASGMLLALLAATLVQPLTLYFVSEVAPLQLVAGYLGMTLACLFFAALGTWISLLVDSPVTAYVITMGAIGVLFLAGLLDSPYSAPVMAAIGKAIGLNPHLETFRNGDLRLADVAWFSGLTVICLTMAHSALCARRIHG